jgi:primosomal protein N' (replication factor Y)
VEAPSAASSRGEPPEGGPSAAPSAPLPLAELTRATGATKDAIRKLAERGLVRLAPGADGREAVTLAVTDRALEDAIVALRRVEKHRAVLELLASHDGPLWIGRIYAETTATLETLRDLAEAGLVSVEEETVWRDPLAAMTIAHDRAPVLTPDQEQVWAAIAPWVGADSPQGRIPPGFLLHGVTGSGKTEIYLRAIARALASGRQAVVLVPEIALTPQTIRRFAARFPGVVTVWHSELGDGERFDIWRRVRTNHPAAQVVVGSRSALFLPFKALGVVVVDEEHEPTYKQERTPRYHARLAARELARLNAAPVILGSATPALESYYAARRGELLLLALPGRIVGHGSLPGAGEPAPLLPGLEGELPAVEIVDMRQELRAGNRSIFSRALSAGLRRVLDANQQAILYLNRRGAASFVLCRDCGHVEACPRCAVPLTYHGEGQQLLCHHCNRRYPVPAACPDCGGSRIRYFGAGTERVEEAVHLEFPAARTLRWDRDATGAKGSHDAILDRFVRHDADILIGTQMIAKGLDLPLVTLVGAVAADTGLYLPDFRAGERTFQLLTQVAGRAGRSALGGSVVIQTYHPDHYAIMAAANHDYEGFYRQEIAFRRELGYPPLSRLARLVYHTGQRTRAEEESRSLAAALRAGAAADPSASIIGPAPCYFAKIRNEYRWQIILRSEDPVALLSGVPIPLGWRVDVDPVDLL